MSNTDLNLSPKQTTSNRRLFIGVQILGAIIILLSVWLPRGLNLDHAVATDEVLWLRRSTRFFLGLKKDLLERTYQKEHPGVTTMWLGTAGLLGPFQEYRAIKPHLTEKQLLINFKTSILEHNPLENLIRGRFFASIANTIVLGLAYWLLIRLIGPVPAFISLLLIAFDPFHLALTRFLHTDGLLTSFYLLTILAYISYLQDRKFYDLVIAGAAAGLAWLTKTPGILLIPTVGVLALYTLWLNFRHSPSSIKKNIWKSAGALAAWGLIGAVVFVIVWPVMWIDPWTTLSRIFIYNQEYAIFGHSADVYFNGYIGQLGSRFFYFYPVTILWRATPVALFGLLATLWGFFSKQGIFGKNKVRFTVIALTLSIIIFITAMTLSTKKFDRYITPVYPMLDILAGLGWVAFAVWVKEKIQSKFAKLAAVLILVAIVGIQFYSALSVFPYGYTYYNPLMGGSKKAPEVMQIGWGEGLDQAALYLNQKENAEDLKVLSWYAPGAFSYFFMGKAEPVTRDGKTWREEILDSDYLVVYIHQWQRNLPPDLLDYVSGWKPEHSIWIKGLEYVRIYKIPE